MVCLILHKLNNQKLELILIETEDILILLTTKQEMGWLIVLFSLCNIFNNYKTQLLYIIVFPNKHK